RPGRADPCAATQRLSAAHHHSHASLARGNIWNPGSMQPLQTAKHDPGQDLRAAASAVRPAWQVPVLLVGNFLSSTLGTRSVCEDLAAQLAAAHWPVLTTSTRRGRLPRLLDMVSTAWRRRHEYAVAQVDVFSGPAFVWAEAVCSLLRRL